MKVAIAFTVEVNQDAYANYYGIDKADVRENVRVLLSEASSMAPHLFDEGIIE
jgi:hypothetical protein